MNTKICAKCKRELPITEFYTHKRDGYKSRCKACLAEDRREYHENNRDRVREYHRRYRANHPEQGITVEKATLLIKMLARRILQLAVYTGMVEKPEMCSQCGKHVDKNKLHGHHTDYLRPVDVVWLCNDCHKEQ